MEFCLAESVTEWVSVVRNIFCLYFLSLDAYSMQHTSPAFFVLSLDFDERRAEKISSWRPAKFETDPSAKFDTDPKMSYIAIMKIFQTNRGRAKAYYTEHIYNIMPSIHAEHLGEQQKDQT